MTENKKKLMTENFISDRRNYEWDIILISRSLVLGDTKLSRVCQTRSFYWVKIRFTLNNDRIYHIIFNIYLTTTYLFPINHNCTFLSKESKLARRYRDDMTVQVLYFGKKVEGIIDEIPKFEQVDLPQVSKLDVIRKQMKSKL